MAIKKPIPITFNLDSRQSVQSVCAVIHIDDKNTETLDLSLMQGGEHIAVSQNSTVTARFVRVKDKILISDNVPCAVQENGNIYIPIDNAAAHMLVGEIKIEVNIVDENDILTMQFPLVIRVNNTILADAEISPESEGTIPELLEEAREAAESATQAAEAATEAISTKQDKLTAGQNITITEENVISASSGSNDYTDLTNKPSINNVTLSGNKSSDDLSLQGKLTAGNNITINNGVISASGGVTSYNDLTDKPSINNVTLSGNKSSGDLNLQDKLTAGDNITIEDNVISATGGVTDYDELENKPQINGVELTGNKTTFDLNIETGTDDYEELNNLPQIENYSPNQLETTNELKNTVSFYPFTSSVRNGKLRLRFDETTVIKCNTADNTISSLNSLPEHIYNSFTHFQYAGAQQIAPFINPKYNSLSLFDYRPTYNGWTQLLFWEDATTNKPKCAFRYTSHNSLIRNVQFKELGSQIVSGVVNANGTITFTDSEGNSFTTSGESVIGADGFSPSATVQQTASGATVSITDKNGTTTANITNGQDGNDYVLTAQDKDDIADIVLAEFTGSIVNGELNTR